MWGSSDAVLSNIVMKVFVFACRWRAVSLCFHQQHFIRYYHGYSSWLYKVSFLPAISAHFRKFGTREEFRYEADTHSPWNSLFFSIHICE
jgi:hypothetical protein